MHYQNDLRITYYDLDMKGDIKLSALMRIVQTAADQNAKEIGVGFSTLAPLNMSFVLQRFGIGITKMPAYDEIVTVRTWPDAIARGTFFRKGDMSDTNGKKLMEWASQWILFDIAERKILKPKALPTELQSVLNMGVEIMPKKIRADQSSGEFYSSYTHAVRYSEVDTNHHMNNSVYGDLISNALYPTMESAKNSAPLREVQINYLAETRLGEVIDVKANRMENGYLVVGEANGRISFTASAI